MIEEYRGKRVKIGGSFSDLTRVAMSGKAKGVKCSFAPGSFIMSGGGMKGFKDAPADWQALVKARPTLAPLRAAPSETYYFCLRLAGVAFGGYVFDLEPVNSDEGRMLVATSPQSESRRTK